MRRSSSIATVLLTLVLFAAPVARAQSAAQTDLSRWTQPVVAGILLHVAGEGAAHGDDLHLPIHQRITIEAVAVDQHGRTYPQERFRFAFELDPSCRGLVELKGISRGTITLETGRRNGSCEALYSVPTNMNLDRHLRIQVGEESRPGDSRWQPLAVDSDEEQVALSLYRAILDRDPDPKWLAAAADEIRREGTRHLVHSLLNAPGFIEHRGRLKPEELLADFYRGLLGRDLDASGLSTYGKAMRRARYEVVIHQILASDEFRRRVARRQG